MCSDVTMKCEMLALVRTQVRALDFKRNPRWKLCSTAYPRRTRTAVSSACLATAAKGITAAGQSSQTSSVVMWC